MDFTSIKISTTIYFKYKEIKYFNVDIFSYKCLELIFTLHWQMMFKRIFIFKYGVISLWEEPPRLSRQKRKKRWNSNRVHSKSKSTNLTLFSYCEISHLCLFNTVHTLWSFPLLFFSIDENMKCKGKLSFYVVTCFSTPRGKEFCKRSMFLACVNFPLTESEIQLNTWSSVVQTLILFLFNKWGDT